MEPFETRHARNKYIRWPLKVVRIFSQAHFDFRISVHSSIFISFSWSSGVLECLSSFDEPRKIWAEQGVEGVQEIANWTTETSPSQEGTVS